MIQQLDLSEPIRYAQTLKQASEAQDLQEQQKTEGQLNIKKLQMAIDQATKDQKENDQIKARIAQGGDPESIAADINKINPDKGAKYYQDLRAQQLAKRQEAIQNYQANPNPAMPQVQVAQPPVAVAAPQPVVAPAPNLPGSTVPAPQPQAPSILRNVNLPNRWQMAPAPDITIPSATGGEPLVIPGVNQEQAIAREQAAKRFATDEAIRAKLSEPVTTAEGAISKIPLTGQVIAEPPAKETDIEKEFASWKLDHPTTNGHPSRLADYVTFKQTSSQPHDVFQESYLPAFLRAHGITATTPQAQKDAAVLKANEDFKKLAQDPAMQEVLRQNAESSRSDRSYALADAQIKDIRKPIDAEAANIAQARDLLNQDNPAANSLAAPAIIKAVVGGVGSGVRITTPEIAAVNSGRGKIDDFKSWLSSWSLDPSKYQKLLPDQKVWLKGVLDKIGEKIQAKQSAISKANEDIITNTDVTKHRQAVKTLNDSLESIDTGAGGGIPINPATGKPYAVGDTIGGKKITAINAQGPVIAQ